MFDFGGVIKLDPFEAFARIDKKERGSSRLHPHGERHESRRETCGRCLSRARSASTSSAGSGPGRHAVGHDVDGRDVLARLAGDLAEMVAAVRTCGTVYKTACLTNNFTMTDRQVSEEVASVYALFDAVLESRVLGVAVPDPRSSTSSVRGTRGTSRGIGVPR